MWPAVLGCSFFGPEDGMSILLTSEDWALPAHEFPEAVDAVAECMTEQGLEAVGQVDRDGFGSIDVVIDRGQQQQADAIYQQCAAKVVAPVES